MSESELECRSKSILEKLIKLEAIESFLFTFKYSSAIELIPREGWVINNYAGKICVDEIGGDSVLFDPSDLDSIVRCTAYMKYRDNFKDLSK